MSSVKDPRVIMIKGSQRSAYNQAIFIMKNNHIGNKTGEKDLVLEAEQIVNAYMKQYGEEPTHDCRTRKVYTSSKIPKTIIMICAILSVLLFIMMMIQSF